MWLILLFVGILFFLGHAIYFSARLQRATVLLLPRAARWVRRLRVAYLVVACFLPVLILAYAVYALIARPETIGLPTSRLYGLLVEQPFWLVTIASLQASLLIAPIDLVRLVLARGLGVAAGPRWDRRIAGVVLAIAAGTAIYVPFRVAADGASLEVREHELVATDLPVELDGFRIALIADLQADEYTGAERLDELVAAVNQARPDLVLIAGDLITRPARYIPLAAEKVGELRAPHGVLSCVGDHDNFAYRDRARSLREVVDALARRGVPMLDNQVREIEVGGARLAVIAATHNYVSRISPETTRELLARAAGADFRVLLAHQAGSQLLADAEAGGVDLFLSGHTHGGQVNFWLPFVELTPARFENRYVTGWHRIGAMQLAVSSGLGMSVAPFRYRSPATVDLIRLRRAPTAAPSAP